MRQTSISIPLPYCTQGPRTRLLAKHGPFLRGRRAVSAHPERARGGPAGCSPLMPSWDPDRRCCLCRQARTCNCTCIRRNRDRGCLGASSTRAHSYPCVATTIRLSAAGKSRTREPVKRDEGSRPAPIVHAYRHCVRKSTNSILFPAGSRSCRSQNE